MREKEERKGEREEEEGEEEDDGGKERKKGDKLSADDGILLCPPGLQSGCLATAAA